MDPRIWQAASPFEGLHVARPALTLGACLSIRRRYHNFRMWRSGQRFHEILEEYDPSPSHHRLDTACLLLLAKEIHEAGQLAKDDGNIDSMSASAHSLFIKDQIARCNSSMLSFEGSSLAVLISIPKMTRDRCELYPNYLRDQQRREKRFYRDIIFHRIGNSRHKCLGFKLVVAVCAGPKIENKPLL